MELQLAYIVAGFAEVSDTGSGHVHTPCNFDKEGEVEPLALGHYMGKQPHNDGDSHKWNNIQVAWLQTKFEDSYLGWVRVGLFLNPDSP